MRGCSRVAGWTRVKAAGGWEVEMGREAEHRWEAKKGV